MGELEGKVVLLTGAGRGVGVGIALALAKAGATLGLTDAEVITGLPRPPQPAPASIAHHAPISVVAQPPASRVSPSRAAISPW